MKERLGMQSRRNIEDLYEEYKLRQDKEKDINGEKYFRIITKEKVAGLEIIVLPNEVFNKPGNALKDELGNVFQVGNPAHMSFRGEIPEWYLRTVSLVVQDVSINEIGEYVHLEYVAEVNIEI